MLPACPHCHPLSEERTQRPAFVVPHGFFTRHSDQKRLQRYRCLGCKKTFSEASLSPCYYQKKRLLNGSVFSLLVSGVSQRRAARILNLNRKTVVRKFLFLGRHAKEYLSTTNRSLPKAHTFQFDDLETFEHSKCKPLSVTMAVEEDTRRILGFRVSQMPAKGTLARVSRKKYGLRKDLRRKGRQDLFKDLKELLVERPLIKSDMNPHYLSDVKRFFPNAHYSTYKGKRGCVTGQGELKATGFDPLFSLNHSFAMTRANINRLFRRTWCTTKIPERLDLHFAMYALYHNLVLIQK